MSVVVDPQGRILVDADAEDARMTRHGTAQTSNSATLRKVCIDDHAVDQAKARAHIQRIRFVRGITRTRDEHRLWHSRGASRCPSD